MNSKNAEPDYQKVKTKNNYAFWKIPPIQNSTRFGLKAKIWNTNAHRLEDK